MRDLAGAGAGAELNRDYDKAMYLFVMSASIT